MNLDVLIDITDGNVQIQKKLIDLFFENTQQNISIMEESFADFSAWSQAAHQLAGASKSLGFIELAEIFSSAQYAQDINDDDRTEILQNVSNLMNTVKELTTSIRNG